MSSNWRPPEGWLTIKDVAKAMDVSPRTIRRKAKNGDLKARMIDSPYGKQWIISRDEINTAQEVIEVVKTKKEYDVKELAMSLSHYLDEREKRLLDRVENMANTQETIKKLTEENARKTDMILRLVQEKNREKKKPWWKKFFKV